MNNIEIAKRVTSFIVGAGTTQIVRGIVTNNTAPNNKADQAAIIGASFVIGSMAADAVRAHSDKMIDELVEWSQNLRKKS